jgi:Ca2+-binding EF-hand superfamily protein
MDPRPQSPVTNTCEILE